MIPKLVIVCFLISGLFAFGWSKDRVKSDRILIFLLPPAVLLSVLYFLAALAYGQVSTWSGLRLAIAAFWAHGVPLYTPENEGLINGMIYGPIPIFFWYPSVLIKDITYQLLTAQLTTCFVSFGALYAVVWWAPVKSSDNREKLVKAVVISLATLFAFGNDDLTYMMSALHVDGIALGLSLLSCLILMSMGEKPNFKTLFLAAFLAQLSIWSKQTEAFVVLGQLVYLGLAHSRKVLRDYVLALAALGLALLGIFALGFGWGPLIYNMVSIPGAHPWHLDSKEAALRTLPPLLVLAVLFTTSRWMASKLPFVQNFSFRERANWAQSNSWILLAIVALAILPMSLASRLKVGGAGNTLHFLYFALALCARLITQSELANRSSATKYGSNRLALLASVLVLYSAFGAPRSLSRELARPNKRQVVYQFLKQNPGDLYFPWYPLATVAAEGKTYHFPYGVYDRFLAGRPVSPEQIRNYVPERAMGIALDRPKRITYGDFLDMSKDDIMVQLLPEFDSPKTTPVLPGWRVFLRE